MFWFPYLEASLETAFFAISLERQVDSAEPFLFDLFDPIPCGLQVGQFGWCQEPKTREVVR